MILTFEADRIHTGVAHRGVVIATSWRAAVTAQVPPTLPVCGFKVNARVH